MTAKGSGVSKRADLIVWLDVIKDDDGLNKFARSLIGVLLWLLGKRSADRLDDVHEDVQRQGLLLRK